MSELRSIPGLLVRRASIDESLAIASILHEAFAQYEPLYTPAAFAATTPASDQIQKRWEEGPVWVAVQNMDLVGTVAVVPKHEGLYVRSMAVLPSARGQGIAEQLLRVIEKHAIAEQQGRLFLSTTPFLTSAIRAYERFGFRKSDEGPHDLFGIPLFTMVKWLPSTSSPPKTQATRWSPDPDKEPYDRTR